MSVDDDAHEWRRVGRDNRLVLRAVAQKVTSKPRLRGCGKTPHTESGSVMIRANGSVWHYSGITTCGLIHICPRCSALIRAGRAVQISRGICNHLDSGGYAEMLTLTLPHDAGDTLKASLGTARDGWREITRRGQWAKLKRQVGFAGFVRVVETTWSARSGWHPHIHAVLLFDRFPDPWALTRFRQYVEQTWCGFVRSRGFRAPSKRYGVDWRPVSSGAEAGAYIAKVQDSTGRERGVGNEIARMDLKSGGEGHYTPFEILEEFRVTGDLELLARWQEWEDESEGLRAITWSRGLKDRLLVDEDDPSDEELAAAEVGGQDVMLIDREDWRKVTRVFGLDAAILTAGETGGIPAARELLARHGINARILIDGSDSATDPPTHAPETTTSSRREV